jgi:peptidoglycan hydrolase-like protein with peptidoglycan-binding domain
MRLGGLVLAVAACAFVASGSARADGKASVAALQVALRANGLTAVRVDGILGPRTRRAIRRFQRRAGLTVDGVVGPRTRRALGRLGRPRFGSRLLRRGRVGWDVAVLQFALERRGFPTGGVDGIFGPGTKVALRAYQRFRGLLSDGIAGPATIGALRRRDRSAGTSLGAQAAAIAERYLGVPYQWGGGDPHSGFDCSGLVQFVYAQLGIYLPHFSGSQWRLGTRIARTDLRAGDLVFYAPRARGPNHVGMYVRDGWQIEAPQTGDVVRYARVKDKAKTLGYVGAVRPY